MYQMLIKHMPKNTVKNLPDFPFADQWHTPIAQNKTRMPLTCTYRIEKYAELNIKKIGNHLSDNFQSIFHVQLCISINARDLIH